MGGGCARCSHLPLLHLDTPVRACAHSTVPLRSRDRCPTEPHLLQLLSGQRPASPDVVVLHAGLKRVREVLRVSMAGGAGPIAPGFCTLTPAPSGPAPAKAVPRLLYNPPNQRTSQKMFLTFGRHTTCRVLPKSAGTTACCRPSAAVKQQGGCVVVSKHSGTGNQQPREYLSPDPGAEGSPKTLQYK